MREFSDGFHGVSMTMVTMDVDGREQGFDNEDRTEEALLSPKARKSTENG